MLTTVNTWINTFPVARAYMWDLTFDTFEGTFPCNALNEEVAVFQNDKISYGPWDFDFPKNSAKGNMDIVVYELDSYSIFSWLEEWLNDYSNSVTWGIGLIGDPNVARQATIEMFSADGSVAQTRTILLLPTGNITYGYTSDKNAQVSPSMAFTIVGT